MLQQGLNPQLEPQWCLALPAELRGWLDEPNGSSSYFICWKPGRTVGILWADPQLREAEQKRCFLLWLNVLKVMTFKICGDTARERGEEGWREAECLVALRLGLIITLKLKRSGERWRKKRKNEREWKTKDKGKEGRKDWNKSHSPNKQRPCLADEMTCLAHFTLLFHIYIYEMIQHQVRCPTLFSMLMITDVTVKLSLTHWTHMVHLSNVFKLSDIRCLERLATMCRWKIVISFFDDTVQPVSYYHADFSLSPKCIQ